MAGSSPRRPTGRVRAIAAFAALLLLAVVPVARAVDEPPTNATNYPGGTWEPASASYGTSLETGRQVRMDAAQATVSLSSSAAPDEALITVICGWVFE